MAHTDPPGTWSPTPETIANSNIAAMMRSRGFASYRELHQWSIGDRSAFWAAVLDDLALDFAEPPNAVNASDDPYRPEWLPGAELNIAACALTGDETRTAIVAGVDGAIMRVTRGDLADRARRVAAGFRSAGFVQGDRVGVAMPMTVEAVAAYLGIILAGGVVVSIADSFAAEEIAVRMELSDAKAVITQDVSRRLGKTLPMAEKCQRATEMPCIVIQTGADVPLREQDLAWEEFVADAGTEPAVTQGAGAYTNILFSSGTTGTPKAIPWSQTPPIKAAMDARYHHDIRAGDVVAWPTNLGWMMGPWLIYASLLNGAAMALYDDAPTTRGFVEFVERAGVTMLGLVPSIVAAWRTSGALTRGDWSTVRVLSSTGEASNASDYSWLMHEAGDVPVIEYCGGTEVGGGYVAGTVVQPAVASRFTTPALGLDFVLLDDEGNETDEGEVFLVPPSIGLSTELLNADHDAVYHTGVPASDRPLRRHGDRMSRDENGYYRALGRADDTMNLGGIKVSSADLEGAVVGIEGVGEVAAIAVPPEGGGPERLVIYYVPVGESDPEDVKQAMQGAIRTRLNPLFRVYAVREVDALPRTASQKVMRRVLRDDFRE